MKNPALLPSLVRRFSRLPLGKTAGHGAYRLAALAAAQVLARVDGVDGVYVTGSLGRTDRLNPGYSDIDFVLTVDLPALRHELELRRGLRRALAMLNVAGEAWKHLDYIESQDLELLAQNGDAWSQGFPSFELLAGVDRRALELRPEPLKRRIELAVSALRRFQAASSIQLDPRDDRPLELVLIGARRTLSDILSSWFDVPRLCPLETLLGIAEREAQPGTVLAELSRRPRETVARTDHEVVVELVTAALEALEQLATELTATFSDDWIGFERRRVTAPPADLDRLGARALAHGFRALYRTLDRDGRDVLYGVPPATDSARESVQRLRRLLDERARDAALSRVPRPVLTTPALFGAAALFDGAPFTGADLALTADCIAGTKLEPPRRPTGEGFRHLLRGRLSLLLWRPRGRGLRTTVDPTARLRNLHRDVHTLAPALLAAFRGETVSLERPPEPSGELDEAELIARLRDVQGVVRTLLEPRAASHTRT